MLQQKIDTIILSSPLPKELKIMQLRNLFEQEGITVFCDLDDTVTDNRNCFYSKNRFLSGFFGEGKIFPLILKDFRINQDFLRLARENEFTSFCIISRNNHRFVSFFIKATAPLFGVQGIRFVAGIGILPEFAIHTADKLEMIPEKSVLISDIFEYKALKHDPRFISVDPYSFRWYFGKKLLKIYSLWTYFIRFFFFRLWR